MLNFPRKRLHIYWLHLGNTVLSNFKVSLFYNSSNSKCVQSLVVGNIPNFSFLYHPGSKLKPGNSILFYFINCIHHFFDLALSFAQKTP